MKTLILAIVQFLITAIGIGLFYLLCMVCGTTFIPAIIITSMFAVIWVFIAALFIDVIDKK